MYHPHPVGRCLPVLPLYLTWEAPEGSLQPQFEGTILSTCTSHSVSMLIQFLASLVRLYTCKLLLLALMIFFGGVDTYHQVRAYNSKATGLSTVTPVYDHY